MRSVATYLEHLARETDKPEAEVMALGCSSRPDGHSQV